MIIEGVSLFADFSEHLPAALAHELMQQGLARIISYLQVDHGCIDLIRNTFYTFYEYLKKTNDREVANNATLLQIAMQMLETFKADGSEEALGAYDNVCSYMSIAGKIVGQSSAYWGPLLGYVQAMESDDIEITHMCQFYIDELGCNVEVAKVKNEVLSAVVKLFFGKFFSTIKNDSDNAELVRKVTEYITENREAAKRVADQSSLFVQKNFRTFFK